MNPRMRWGVWNEPKPGNPLQEGWANGGENYANKALAEDICNRITISGGAYWKFMVRKFGARYE